MSPLHPLTISSSDYQILVKQSFRCNGVIGYSCPMFMRTFDRSGYYAIKMGTEISALCPSCHAVHCQNQATAAAAAAAASAASAATTIDSRIQVKQRIIHFLHSMRWTVGGGEYTLPFKEFWQEFYRWSEKERLFTKKTLVRSVVTEMCGMAQDASHLYINPV